MGIVISEQSFAFFASLLFGFFLGLCYEFLRILRAAIRHNVWSVGIEDFFFAITCAFSVILLCYAYTSGQVRWFVPAGMFVGVLCYFLSLGRLISLITPALLACLNKFFKTLYRFTLHPIIRKASILFQKLHRFHKRQTDKRIRRKLLNKP